MVTRTRRAGVPYVCALFVLALIALSSTMAGAATFNWAVLCPTDTVVGPVTVSKLTPAFSGTVDLTVNVPVTLALFPTAIVIIMNDNAAAPGIYTGTLSCTLTFGGVIVPFTRSYSLEVTAGPLGTLTVGAATALVNLGPQGLVTLSAPVSSIAGAFNRTFPNGFPLGIPIPSDTTALLTLPTVPTLSTWAWMLMLAVLLGSALIFLRRGVVKRI